MRALIVGGQGMLGRELCDVFSADHEVLGIGMPEFDMTKPGACEKLVREFRPTLVINSAALTAVDYCESHEAEAFSVNAEGAANLAAAAAGVQGPFIQYSTDYVFDGNKTGPYTEDDATSPLSAYGRSKLGGELRVREATPDHLILRTAWLFGVAGNNFIRTIFSAGRDGRGLRVVSDQQGSPTYARDLAAHTRLLVESGCRGTFHLTNAGSCTWYELACRVVGWAGLGVSVTPVTSAEFPRPAPRPRNSVMENRRLREAGLPPMRHWQEAAREYVEILATQE
jgi:dTDP-4-dehydrorhamnose reductase